MRKNKYVILVLSLLYISRRMFLSGECVFGVGPPACGIRTICWPGFECDTSALSATHAMSRMDLGSTKWTSIGDYILRVLCHWWITYH
uniref:Secreted protein n=1 Tax=Ixodes scapularis TaxID=6945 RepID=A0A4D5RF14_IXOSC